MIFMIDIIDVDKGYICTGSDNNDATYYGDYPYIEKLLLLRKKVSSEKELIMTRRQAPV